MPELLTPNQAREALEREGKTLADFAQEHQIPKHIVYQVISGGAHSQKVGNLSITPSIFKINELRMLIGIFLSS